MTLRARIVDHLGGLERWRLTSFGSPVLHDEEGTLPVLVRFLGRRRYGDRLREVCEVEAVIAPTADSEAIDGAGTETACDQLIDDLNDVADCFPELIGAIIDYERAYVKNSRHTFIVVAVQVLGP
ncbi:hypothetical protein F4Y93_12225 [Candidatus Poribacteria bacterium]|nr:hypothetical protein [Candidatus Poribacteria bacterium]